MHEDNVIYITADGLQKIKDELDYLKNSKRPDISKRLQEAIAQGDLSENADYHYAKQEQSFMEGRIKDLEDSLRRVELIKEGGPAGVVRVGSTVTVMAEDADEPETYRIVGVHEADPSKGFISNESPLGRGLLGSKIGKKVAVETPSGAIYFKIKGIK